MENKAAMMRGSTCTVPQLKLDHIFPEPNIKKKVLTRNISVNPSKSQERKTRTSLASLLAHDMENEAAKMRPTCTMPQLELDHISIPEAEIKKKGMLTRSNSANPSNPHEDKTRSVPASKFSPPINYDRFRSKSRRIQPLTASQFLRSFTTKEEDQPPLKRSASFSCSDFSNEMRSKKFTQYVRSSYTFTADTNKETVKRKLTKLSTWCKNNMLKRNKKRESSESRTGV